MAQPIRPKVREAPYGYTLTLVPGTKDALAGFAAALWEPAGAVPQRTKELVFLRTSLVNACPT
jgi:hypothetical protein